jgi:hypothetical protein
LVPTSGRRQRGGRRWPVNAVIRERSGDRRRATTTDRADGVQTLSVEGGDGATLALESCHAALNDKALTWLPVSVACARIATVSLTKLPAGGASKTRAGPAPSWITLASAAAEVSPWPRAAVAKTSRSVSAFAESGTRVVNAPEAPARLAKGTGEVSTNTSSRAFGTVVPETGSGVRFVNRGRSVSVGGTGARKRSTRPASPSATYRFPWPSNARPRGLSSCAARSEPSPLRGSLTIAWRER